MIAAMMNEGNGVSLDWTLCTGCIQLNATRRVEHISHDLQVAGNPMFPGLENA